MDLSLDCSQSLNLGWQIYLHLLNHLVESHLTNDISTYEKVESFLNALTNVLSTDDFTLGSGLGRSSS